MHDPCEKSILRSERAAVICPAEFESGRQRFITEEDFASYRFSVAAAGAVIVAAVTARSAEAQARPGRPRSSGRGKTVAEGRKTASLGADRAAHQSPEKGRRGLAGVGQAVWVGKQEVVIFRSR